MKLSDIPDSELPGMNYWDLPPQCAPDGRPWEAVGPDEEFLCDILDLDDDPMFARFCDELRRCE